jgi:hypothetical protein
LNILHLYNTDHHAPGFSMAIDNLTQAFVDLIPLEKELVEVRLPRRFEVVGIRWCM